MRKVESIFPPVMARGLRPAVGGRAGAAGGQERQSGTEISTEISTEILCAWVKIVLDTASEMH
jgi:hypothetical protein